MNNNLWDIKVYAFAYLILLEAHNNATTITVQTLSGHLYALNKADAYWKDWNVKSLSKFGCGDLGQLEQELLLYYTIKTYRLFFKKSR